MASAAEIRESNSLADLLRAAVEDGRALIPWGEFHPLVESAFSAYGDNTIRLTLTHALIWVSLYGVDQDECPRLRTRLLAVNAAVHGQWHRALIAACATEYREVFGRAEPNPSDYDSDRTLEAARDLADALCREVGTATPPEPHSSNGAEFKSALEWWKKAIPVIDRYGGFATA